MTADGFLLLIACGIFNLKTEFLLKVGFPNQYRDFQKEVQTLRNNNIANVALSAIGERNSCLGILFLIV